MSKFSSMHMTFNKKKHALPFFLSLLPCMLPMWLTFPDKSDPRVVIVFMACVEASDMFYIFKWHLPCKQWPIWNHLKMVFTCLFANTDYSFFPVTKKRWFRRQQSTTLCTLISVHFFSLMTFRWCFLAIHELDFNALHIQNGGLYTTLSSSTEAVVKYWFSI